MLQRHDWVTPVLYGQPWLEKPPLYYWCAMHRLQRRRRRQRLGGAAANCDPVSLMLFFIYRWARRFRPGMQLDAALITAAAAMVIGFGRSASTDMPLTVMFTVAMLSLVRLACQPEPKLAAGVLFLLWRWERWPKDRWPSCSRRDHPGLRLVAAGLAG